MSDATVYATPPFPFAGEVFSLTAALIWAASTCIYRRFAGNMPASAINLFKNAVALFCLLALAAIIWLDSTFGLWSGSELASVGNSIASGADRGGVVIAVLSLAASGVIGIALGDTAFFKAMAGLGAQMTSAIQCLAPALTALLALIVLGETMAISETLGMLVTILAVAGVVWTGQRAASQEPSASAMDMPALRVAVALAVLAALCQAIGLVMSREALQHVHVVAGSLLRIAPAVLVLMAVAMLRAQPGLVAIVRSVWREQRSGLFLTLAAFSGTFLGLVLSSAGVKYAKAGVVAALSSTYPILVIPIAWLFLGERVNPRSVLYTVLAVAGVGILMSA